MSASLPSDSSPSNDFYRRAYLRTAMPICEWDFGDCFREVERLQEEMGDKVVGYLEANPELVLRLAWTCKPVNANPAACQLIGVETPEEFCRRIAECYSESSMKQFIGQLRSFSLQEKFYRGMAQLITFRGEKLDIFTEIAWPEPGSKESRIFVTLTDVTELLLAREQLTERNLQLKTFATVAAHDLKEPLRMITGYASVLEQEVMEDDESILADGIRKMATSARAVKRILGDALAYAQAGVQPVVIVDIKLSNTITQIAEEIEASFPDRKIELEVSELPVIQGDEAQVRQIFRNLLTNAVKFTDGQVVPIRVTWDLTDRLFHHVSVTDEGVGIDLQYHERIFLAFQRHVGENLESSGIGLAICRRLVEGMGGKISVESDLGMGAKFTVKWPRAPRPTQEASLDTNFRRS